MGGIQSSLAAPFFPIEIVIVADPVGAPVASLQCQFPGAVSGDVGLDLADDLVGVFGGEAVAEVGVAGFDGRDDGFVLVDIASGPVGVAALVGVETQDAAALAAQAGVQGPGVWVAACFGDQEMEGAGVWR